MKRESEKRILVTDFSWLKEGMLVEWERCDWSRLRGEPTCGRTHRVILVGTYGGEMNDGTICDKVWRYAPTAHFIGGSHHCIGPHVVDERRLFLIVNKKPLKERSGSRESEREKALGRKLEREALRKLEKTR